MTPSLQTRNGDFRSLTSKTKSYLIIESSLLIGSVTKINYFNAWKFLISHGYLFIEMSASGNYMPSIQKNPNRWKEALNWNETLWSLPLIWLPIFVLWENCQSAFADSLSNIKNQISRNILRPWLFRSCPNILKFCVDYCSLNVVLCAKFLNDRATDVEVMGKRDFARCVYKISFGWVFYSATILVPFIEGRLGVCCCLVMGLRYLLSCLGTVLLKDKDKYLEILFT